jgi:hypothetical protein
MVKKIGILGFILIVVAATGMVWAETYTGAIPAPQPMVMPAAAPPMCGPAGCPPPVPVKMKAPAKPQKMTTVIDVKMQYPAPPMMACPPPMYGPAGCAPPPPIPVAVPMWKFIVPWPPFVYYLPVE